MNIVLSHLGDYAHGMEQTVVLTLVSYLGAFVIGLAVASCRVSPVPPLRAIGTLYVDIVRNVPLLVQFFIFFFGLTKVGIQFAPFTTAIIVLSMYHGAFVGEVVRAGINTVDKGQIDAARALGFTFPAVLVQLVLPQAIRSVVQPLGNVFIALIKNSSVAYFISVVELLGTADRLNTETAQGIPVFIGAAVGYLILALSSAYVLRQMEKRLAVVR